LTNESEPDFGSFRKLLRGLSEQVDSKLCQKIIAVLKRYKKHYEEKPRFIICRNPDRQKTDREKRQSVIESYKTELEQIFADSTKKGLAKKQKGQKTESKSKKSASELNRECETRITKLFVGYKAKYSKFFHIQRDERTQQATGYQLNQPVIDFEHKFDGVFALLTKHDSLTAGKIIDSYKNLQEVESLFDDLKHFVDIHPIRHRLEQRVRAHVFVCILALLLKRLFEINYLKGKSVTKPLTEIEKVKLVRYKVKFSQREDRHQVIPKVTNITTNQKTYFNMIGLKNPSNLESFMW
jgi:transposase